MSAAARNRSAHAPALATVPLIAVIRPCPLGGNNGRERVWTEHFAHDQRPRPVDQG